jgi:hypothetical protein
MRNTTPYSTAALVLAFLSACSGPNFEEFGEVSKLRTIAISSDPAELGPGEVASLVVHSAYPDPDVALEHAWEACLFTDGAETYFACAEGSGDVPGGFPLGEGSGAEVAYDAIAGDGSILREICDSFDDVDLPPGVLLPSCDRGIPITIRVTSRAVDAPDDVEIALRDLLLLFPEEAARDDRNHNPVVTSIRIGDVEVGDGSGATVVPLEDGTIELEAVVDLADAETYTVPTPEEGSGTRSDELRERLTLTWYSSAGIFESTRTYYDEELAPAEEFTPNTLDLSEGTPPSADGVQIWLVIRDNRGGSSVLEAVLSVAE